MHSVVREPPTAGCGNLLTESAPFKARQSQARHGPLAEGKALNVSHQWLNCEAASIGRHLGNNHPPPL